MIDWLFVSTNNRGWKKSQKIYIKKKKKKSQKIKKVLECSKVGQRENTVLGLTAQIEPKLQDPF